MQLSKSKDSSIRPLPAESTPGSGGPQWPLMHYNDTNQPFRRLRAGDVLGARFIFLSATLAPIRHSAGYYICSNHAWPFTFL